MRFHLVAFAVVVLWTSGSVGAQGASHEHEGHDAMAQAMKMPGQSPAAVPMVDGLVKKIDKAAGKVTLAHGPLTNLGMDMAMTMAFRVKDAGWLARMKVGDKIRFVADDINGELTVVKYEAVK